MLSLLQQSGSPTGAFQGALSSFADDTAAHFHVTRQNQDAYAIESFRRTQDAISKGFFARELVPLDLVDGKNRLQVYQDETPSKVRVEKVPHLKPAFCPDGTVTAANSSPLPMGLFELAEGRLQR